MRALSLCVTLLLLTGCGADARRPGPMSGKIGSCILDFAGERHTLLVALEPDAVQGAKVTSTTPSSRKRPFDLEMRNEAGYPARITGNGRRSVAFVGLGGRELFDTVCEHDDAQSLHDALPKTNVYFSPGLRGEETVEGCVFLAKVERGENGTEKVGMARILIEEVGDTTLTLKISIGPAW